MYSADITIKGATHEEMVKAGIMALHKIMDLSGERSSVFVECKPDGYELSYELPVPVHDGPPRIETIDDEVH